MPDDVDLYVVTRDADGVIRDEPPSQLLMAAPIEVDGVTATTPQHLAAFKADLAARPSTADAYFAALLAAEAAL